MSNLFGATARVKKVYETRLSTTTTVPSKSTESIKSANIPSLSEILSKDGNRGLRTHHGPFVYTHIPADQLKYLAEDERKTSRECTEQKF